VGLLTDRITNKSEKSNLINAHAPSHEPVPLNATLSILESSTLVEFYVKIALNVLH